MRNAPRGGRGALLETAGQSSTESVPATPDKTPEPRWCRYAAIYCRCGIERIETAAMTACAAHYLHELSGHE